MNKMVIIGAGNIGYHLAVRMADNNTDVKNKLLIVNHRENTVTKKLRDKNFNVITNLTSIPTDAEIYLLCVKDSMIKEIATSVKNKIPDNAVVIHTSGATRSDILSGFNHCGVLYPLYSFLHSEEKTDWSKISVFITSNNEYANDRIYQIARLLQPFNIYKINDNEKLIVHLMAVFANNFTNALMHAVYILSHQTHLSTELCNTMSDFAIQTIERTAHQNPAQFQTGPAVRNDKNTIEIHLKYLENYPELKQLYLSCTQYIMNNIANENKK